MRPTVAGDLWIFGETGMNVNGMLKGDLSARYQNMADLMEAEFQGLHSFSYNLPNAQKQYISRIVKFKI